MSWARYTHINHLLSIKWYGAVKKTFSSSYYSHLLTTSGLKSIEINLIKDRRRCFWDTCVIIGSFDEKIFVQHFVGSKTSEKLLDYRVPLLERQIFKESLWFNFHFSQLLLEINKNKHVLIDPQISLVKFLQSPADVAELKSIFEWSHSSISPCIDSSLLLASFKWIYHRPVIRMWIHETSIRSLCNCYATAEKLFLSFSLDVQRRNTETTDEATCDETWKSSFNYCRNNLKSWMMIAIKLHRNKHVTLKHRVMINNCLPINHEAFAPKIQRK